MIYTTRKDIVDAVICNCKRATNGQIEQLYSCKAWIIKPYFSDFLILKSYSTIVAAFQFSTGILWVFGHYSTTTAQHVAKFCKWLRYEFKTGWNYPETVRLYNDYKTGKRAAQKNLEDDFASVIATALNKRIAAALNQR